MASFDPGQCDPAMLELFQAEMDTHVPVLSDGLLALEKGQAGAKEIEAMMRAAHSIKGAARIVGIEPAVRVSHLMEDCFTAAKENRITLSSDSVDVMLQAVDALHRICSPQSGPAMSERSLQELLDRIANIKQGNVAAPARANPPAPTPPPVASPQLVAATVERAEPSITLPAVFDDASTKALRQELLSTLGLHPTRIQIDFTHVRQLPAAGLAMLVAFAGQVNTAQPVPIIKTTGMSPPVKSLLQICGIGGTLGLAG